MSVMLRSVTMEDHVDAVPVTNYVMPANVLCTFQILLYQCKNTLKK